VITVTIGESIKQLLEERKRVILPGFGNLEIKDSGGVVPYSAKRIDPPGLIVRFDSSFSKDDGLLAEAFSQYGGVDKEEAEQQVLELVDAIRFSLDKGEKYPLADAGFFSRDDEGKIHFQPNPSWVLEPDLYGLGSMDLLELEDLPEVEDESNGISLPAGDKEEEAEPVPDSGPILELIKEEDFKPEEKSKEKPKEKVKKPPLDKPTQKPVAKLVTRQTSKTRAKKRSMPVGSENETDHKRRAGFWRVIWILAGILIVVLVVLLLIPGDKEGSTGENSQLQKPVQQEQTIQPEQPVSTPELSDQALPGPEQEMPLVEQANHFFIIAGSFRNLANASELQDKLKARGYPAEIMITENRMYRVSVASYPKSGEAEKRLAEIKTETGMESCWLLANE
jgi:nucleoid DNA-binding protein